MSSKAKEKLNECSLDEIRARIVDTDTRKREAAAAVQSAAAAGDVDGVLSARRDELALEDEREALLLIERELSKPGPKEPSQTELEVEALKKKLAGYQQERVDLKKQIADIKAKKEKRCGGAYAIIDEREIPEVKALRLKLIELAEQIKEVSGKLFIINMRRASK